MLLTNTSMIRNSLALKEKRNELNEKLAKKERKRKKKQRKEEKERQRIRDIEKELERSGYQFRNLPSTNYSTYGMAESNESAQNGEAVTEDLEISEVTRKARDVVAEIEAEERRELEELKNKQREPPITFRDAVDVKEEYNALVGLVNGKLNAEEQQCLEELKQYMLMDEGSWALGDGFLNFVGRLLHDKSLSADIRTKLLNVMSCAALKDDVILLLHQDRRDHVLMNYAGDVERLTLEEQQALALFFVNMFENLSSSEWLLYISEWEHNNNSLSNIRVTTKVGINSLLSENPILQERGSAIVHNMACKESHTYFA
ncbi:hypothetical protein RUM43_004515 [Polyplax serrata]|uniref:Uncharacterized protein n=1 Tax=Polyplax serrata TaxID=468196 RepID=A0AAN8SC41_POLSC